MYGTLCRLQGALIFANNRKLSFFKVKFRCKKILKCDPPVLLSRLSFIPIPTTEEFQGFCIRQALSHMITSKIESVGDYSGMGKLPGWYITPNLSGWFHCSTILPSTIR